MASDNIISNYFKVYGRIALYLTDIELHRTQVEHDNAYIYKLWILSFVNYYLPVIYIAFFKVSSAKRPSHIYIKTIKFRVDSFVIQEMNQLQVY